jgi:hypothetical protein
VLRMIEQALEAWNSDPSRTAQADEPVKTSSTASLPRNYPKDGLVLKMYVRDLPRDDTRNSRLNLDYVWITKDEVKQFVPDTIKTGDRFAVPQTIVKRIARNHLVDTVRGECPPWQLEHIRKAEMNLVVESIERDVIGLRLEGHVRLVASPDGAVNPYSNRAVDKERGIDSRLLGYLTYDRAKEKFEQVRIIAVGPRWGAYVYNGRSNDPGPVPIGFAFEMTSGSSSSDLTEPMALGPRYFD